MSKSKPDSMISIHDDAATVQKKFNKAFCPEKQVEDNPVLEICKYVIFPELAGEVFCITRPEKFGGSLEFTRYEDLENAYREGLHPLDLKNATAQYVNSILESIHAYFEKHSTTLDKMKALGILP